MSFILSRGPPVRKIDRAMRSPCEKPKQMTVRHGPILWWREICGCESDCARFFLGHAKSGLKTHPNFPSCVREGGTKGTHSPSSNPDAIPLIIFADLLGNRPNVREFYCPFYLSTIQFVFVIKPREKCGRRKTKTGLGQRIGGGLDFVGLAIGPKTILLRVFKRSIACFISYIDTRQ